jgi:hypothetical protein
MLYGDFLIFRGESPLSMSDYWCPTGYFGHPKINSMKKIILTFGLISGAIVAAVMLGSIPLWKSGILNFDNGQWVGYTSMVIALSVNFVAIKSYRDNYQQGSISFGKGLKIGLSITLIASVMYALAWEVSYNFFTQDFTAKMTEHYLEENIKAGATPAQLEEQKAEMKKFQELYDILIVRFGMTLMEIFPVGLIITLISAGLLRKKELLPPTNYEYQSKMQNS